jgi:hypothetical protein
MFVKQSQSKKVQINFYIDIIRAESAFLTNSACSTSILSKKETAI